MKKQFLIFVSVMFFASAPGFADEADKMVKKRADTEKEYRNVSKKPKSNPAMKHNPKIKKSQKSRESNIRHIPAGITLKGGNKTKSDK